MERVLVPDGIEYLVLASDLTIVSMSAGVALFADDLELLRVGEDVRSSFPELIGLEETIEAIAKEEIDGFLLKSIARFIDPQTPLYVSLSLKKDRDNILVYLQDMTELMTLKQSLIQRANESEFLLNSLSISQDYLQTILVSMGDSLLITTSSGNIKKVNRAAENLFGYNETELSGQPLGLLVIRDNFFVLKIYQHLLQNNGSIERLEIDCQHRDGRQLAIEFSCSLVQTEIKGLFDVVFIGRDITDRLRMEAETRQALEKEKVLNELKSRFVAITSHEFRNPLSSILGCVEILNDFKNYEQEEIIVYLDYIKQSALNMQFLLEDILVLGKAEAGKMKFQPELCNLRIFCQDLMREIKLINRDERIVCSVRGQLKPVLVDRKLLRQALINLLSNALKYSPEEKTVEFQVYTKGKNIVFGIRDRGIGIPTEDIQHLFESFHRAKNVGSISGTGLGLSIVKKSIELHGGSIEIDSEINAGTNVTVRIPLQEARAETKNPEVIESNIE
jgi:PAS domain S-box-containing protein